MNKRNSAAPLLVAALFLFAGCADHGSGGSGGGAGTFAITTTAAAFGVVGNAYSSTPATANGIAPFTGLSSADRCQPGCR